jgi:lipoyl synthase
MKEKTHIRKPDWLKIKVPKGNNYVNVKDIVSSHDLHTICTSGHCPNMAECWGSGTATLMILGDVCTRACRFCNVKSGKPPATDWMEPDRVANSIRLMGLKHAVITSVDRDDLPDKGSGIWALTIRRVKETNPGLTMEVLIPDFDGIHEHLDRIVNEHPEVISHNLETVERLTPIIRSKAKYRLSLEVIKYLSDAGCTTKSGLMLGIGEREEEVVATMDDLRQAGCKVLTMGQYLQPTARHLKVKEYIHPDQFERYREMALSRGFRHVESSPLVRSSYHAEKHVH